MPRRLLAACSMLLVLMASTVASISAQGTPAATGGLLSELGYPEVVITATETGFEVPAEVPAVQPVTAEQSGEAPLAAAAQVPAASAALLQYRWP